MRFLIDEDLPRSMGDVFRRYGHEAVDVRDVGLRGAKDSEIAAYAKQKGLCPDPQAATARALLNLLEAFLKQRDLLPKLPGKLAIVRPEHIRIRGE